MRPILLAMLAAGAVNVTACGGSDVQGSMPSSYAFVPPPVNSQRKYSETIVDNQNNAIELSYTETVLSAIRKGPTWSCRKTRITSP